MSFYIVTYTASKNPTRDVHAKRALVEAASAQDAIYTLERHLEAVKVVSAEEVFSGTPDCVIQQGR